MAKSSYFEKAVPEVKAGLVQRCRMVMRAYGGRAAFAKHFGIPYLTVKTWEIIPYYVAPMIQKDSRKLFTSRFCRPDLLFYKSGELKGGKQRIKSKKIYT